MDERANVLPLPSRLQPKEGAPQPLALEFTNPPSPLLIEPIVRVGLVEDLGRAGDITTDAVIPASETARAVIAAREAGVVSGLIAADLAFKLVDPTVRLTPRAPDGSEVVPGSVIVHLSGVATATQRLVKAVAGTSARIICTRKTLPGLRVLQ